MKKGWKIDHIDPVNPVRNFFDLFGLEWKNYA